ncbi:hypothetical protein OsJ_07821 [Oryza sativa Japonica Group]|uniref:Uncharacterized protein n=1 Tax=Oryza sativa subsp. japonica TaxID=39947 RepID=A3A9U6_ORYSJ|nr:hypothetical protein OsJ_07821 [Oryza sativa Japonica Group]
MESTKRESASRKSAAWYPPAAATSSERTPRRSLLASRATSLSSSKNASTSAAPDTSAEMKASWTRRRRSEIEGTAARIRRSTRSVAARSRGEGESDPEEGGYEGRVEVADPQEGELERRAPVSSGDGLGGVLAGGGVRGRTSAPGSGPRRPAAAEESGSSQPPDEEEEEEESARRSRGRSGERRVDSQAAKNSRIGRLAPGAPRPGGGGGGGLGILAAAVARRGEAVVGRARR